MEGLGMKYVYHGSAVQNIQIFRPQASTHGQNWVYAAKDKVISALFISGVGGDFTCQVGRDPITGKPYLCERFSGAFQLRYGGRSGSIYTLPGDHFQENRTGWEEEVVSPVPVVPIAEEKIADVQSYLLRLEQEGMLIIKYFPEKIDGIPEDDEDLMERGIIWTRQFGERILAELAKYHPHLLERVQQGLREGKYLSPHSDR